MESLLEDQDNFEFSESNHLFGRHFLRAMVRTADDEAKLNAVGRNNGSSTSRHRRDSRGRRLDQRKDRHPSRNQFDKAYGKNQGYSHQNNGYVTIPSNIPLVDKTPIPVGGRLGSYALAWNRFSKDPWVLSIVAFGLQIEFLSRPIQFPPPPPNKVSGDLQLEIIESEIDALLGKLLRKLKK